MTEVDNALLDPFVRLIEQIADVAAARRVEKGADHSIIWRQLRESGYVDALVCEEAGGAGLTPGDIAPLLIAAGRHLLPLALGETMIARALASAAGAPLPVEAPVLLWPTDEYGHSLSFVPPALAGATHALVQRGERVQLRRLGHKSGHKDGYGVVGAELAEDDDAIVEFDQPDGALLRWSVALTSVAMAGAMEGMLSMTLKFVNERSQFGRPLAKFQAIQHQVSVFAEQVVCANFAAKLAFSRPMPGPTALDAATGKTIADQAAIIACDIAHAAHGAIGITEEHDLPLFVRRLKRWQLSFGSGVYWSRLIGAQRLKEPGNSVDFIRALR